MATSGAGNPTSQQRSASATGETHLYAAYGLVFESDMPLLLLPRIEGDTPPAVDVKVRLGSVPRVAPPPACGSVVCWSEGSDSGFQVPTLGEFRVIDGREIIYDLNPDGKTERVPAYVIGVAMALILHQRGFLVLHGSAVEHDGKCYAFVAPKYHGKSTVSATLQARGCRLVTDDLIPVRINDAGIPMVSPGYPFSKVWPDVFTAMGEDPDHHPRFLDGFEKRLRMVPPESMATSPIPLERIYVLGWSEKPTIERLSRAEAFQQAVTHTHHHVLPLVAAESGGQIRHFQALGSLLRHTTVSRLQRPRLLESLDTVCNDLLKDFEKP